jgi:putative nucleotidyltransferase-like protein
MRNISHRPAGDAIWEGVDRLVDRAPTLADLRSHRIELLAARRWRDIGRAVPEEFLELERRSALHRLVAPRLLERVRAAYDGPMIVHKGPEVAAHYPDPILRSYGDVDLIVPDADEAQRALLAAGFEEIGDPAFFVGIQHLQPLRWPDLPLRVEIHFHPKWVGSRPAPSFDELFAAAAPSKATIDGFLALPPEHHALILAAHSWAHEPLRVLRDVIDIAAVADAADLGEIQSLAREWRVSRLWRSTTRAIGAVLLGGIRPASVRLWARNLALARERTVLEGHLERWLSDFSILPLSSALAALPATFRRELGPEGEESWDDKLGRTQRAARHAFKRRSEHDKELIDRLK